MVFEQIIQECVTLRCYGGVEKNDLLQKTNYDGVALISKYTKRDINRFGNIRHGRVVLLRCDKQPESGNQIIDSENCVRNIKEVQICKDLDGNIECYRCVTI